MGFQFTVDRVLPTAVGELEFSVALTRTPRRQSTADDADAELRDGERTAALIAELRSMPSLVASAPPPAADESAGFPLSAREIRLIESKRKVMSTLRRWRAMP